jgi:hypothetical protein
VVSFTLRQVTDIVDGPAYKVTNQVVAATDADVYAFVYNAASQKFSHYATAADMQQWPTSLALAQVSNIAFYRLDTVERTWATVGEMNDDLAETVRRIQALADELNQVNGSLTIDRTTVIQGA